MQANIRRPKVQCGLSMTSQSIPFFVWVDPYSFDAVKRKWIDPNKKRYGSTEMSLKVYSVCANLGGRWSRYNLMKWRIILKTELCRDNLKPRFLIKSSYYIVSSPSAVLVITRNFSLRPLHRDFEINKIFYSNSAPVIYEHRIFFFYLLLEAH